MTIVRLLTLPETAPLYLFENGTQNVIQCTVSIGKLFQVPELLILLLFRFLLRLFFR